MSQAGPAVRPGDGRVSLGIPELDSMLDGGLMAHRPYLLVGPAGTGKTTLALQFLCEGVRRGERSLYVTVEDPPNEVLWNHRALRPTLDSVDVFDAIPDVMRYERAPFKDISATRAVSPFGKVPERIRQTPEFTSVEVTGTALEQMLRTEVQRRGYARLVIDSLTALQYFCMKGFDPIVGAQTFLRFLTELRTTTLLTVESPLEDVESPERMLARGEVRLFRWELDGATVRAVGVEKFRGSSHDVRLHPYRIGSKGIDIQIAQTISRDTRRIVEPALAVAMRAESTPSPTAAPSLPSPVPSSDPLAEQIGDLVVLGVDVAPLRSEVEAALAAVRASRIEEVTARLTRISAMAVSLAPLLAPPATTGAATQAFQRVAARAERSREGRPPTVLPPLDVLAHELTAILGLVPTPAPRPRTPPAAPAPSPPATPPREARPAPTAPPAGVPQTTSPPPTPPPPARTEPARPTQPGGRHVEEPPRPEPYLPAPPPRTAPRRAARRAAAPSLPEPPPLPAVAHLPSGPPPEVPAPPSAPAAVASVAPADVARPPAPARRRRKVTPPRAPVVPTAPTAEVAGSEPVGPVTEPLAPVAASTPKPRKRVVRRKKAPPVVSSAPVSAPETPPPAPAPSSPAPPTAEGTPPPEGS